MSFARSARLLLAVAPLLAPLGGCGYFSEELRQARQLVWGDQPAEFAPPQSRWPDTLPAAVSAEAPPPDRTPRYCYRTLAQVDCFEAPNPERRTGYTGSYPTPNSIP